MVNQDFKEFFASLNASGVDYLIIGGVAYNYFAPPRSTKDVDVWVGPWLDNVQRFLCALKEFGFPIDSLEAETLVESDSVLILGRAPNRIDVLTRPGGVDWEAAWASRVATDYAGVPVSVCSLNHLISMKRHAGRPRDLVDIEMLKRIQERGNEE